MAEKTHRHDLNEHLDGEEDENAVIESLQYSTPSRHTRDIIRHSE